MMGLGALHVIRSASAELVEYAAHGTVRLLRLRLVDLALLLATVFIKLVLWLHCRTVHARTSNVTVGALAQDNKNDVLSNTLAIAAAGATQLRASLWICDPIGALLISLYIIYTWVQTAIEQVQMIVGRSADPAFVEVVREMAETHDPSISLDVVRAYHFGPKYLVELEIVMPHDTQLMDSHDVAIRLQHKVESLTAVERCFVHVDYQQRGVDEHDKNASLRDKTSVAAAVLCPPDLRLDLAVHGHKEPLEDECRPRSQPILRSPSPFPGRVGTGTGGRKQYPHSGSSPRVTESG
jgi:divalent metal cation (Fe/Co/Zn/Cd) transporter